MSKTKKDIIREAIQDIRDLRDSDSHVCPAVSDDMNECSCGKYDLVIDKLEKLLKGTLL